LIHDLDFEIAELGVDFVQIVWRHDAIGQGIVDVL